MANLKYLKPEGCMSLSSIIPSNLLIKLVNLEAITVERCQLIQEVFDLEGLTTDGDVEILSRLTTLTLSRLPNLGCIWNKNPRRLLCHQNLRTLKVQMCENLRFLFSSSMVKALVQIKEIEIASCVLIEEIMHVQPEESEEAAIFDTLEFPMLTSLSLVELPNLRAFTYGKCCIQCPSLTKLRITGCPQMMTFSSFEGTQQSMIADTSVQEAFGRVNSSLSLPGFFNEKVLFPSLEELKLSSMCQLKRIWHNQLHEQSFCKLASLTVEFCENLSHVFPSNSMDRLQSLKEIEVVDCPFLEVLFEPERISSEKRQNSLVLCALEKMKLLNLPRLRDILKSDCKVTLAFPSLMEVNVRCCHSLSYLFSSATAKTLDKLAVLDVSCCDNLRGITAVEQGKGRPIEILKFHQLSTLKLGDLDKFISFRLASCAGDGLHPLFDEKLAFPKLEELHVQRVQQEELWNEKILVESFCRLKVLNVKQCHNLMNVIPSSMWNRLLRCMKSLTIEKCSRLRNLFTMPMTESLGQLQYLFLRDCGEMDYIVAREEGKPEEAADQIVISQIVTLYLHNMPKLRSFYQGKHVSKWPSLKECTVEDCKAVEVIIGNAEHRELEDNVPMPQSLLLLEKVSLPSLESLTLSELPKLKYIWNSQLPLDMSKLKFLKVKGCEFLLSIIPTILLVVLQNLEVVTVENCQLIREVFDFERPTISEDVKILSRLTTLTLSNLPRLEHIWSKDQRLCLQNLRALKVQNCESLRLIFSSSMAQTLQQIKEIEIVDCRLLEEIIDVQEEESEEAALTGPMEFPLLTSLSLEELPNLRTFSYGTYHMHCPTLTKLRISECPKMMTFPSIERKQPEKIADTGFQREFGGTNFSCLLPVFFNNNVLFPSLEKLTLMSLPGLTKIWHDELSEESFCKLTSIMVHDCENLSHIFPSTFIGRLQSLEEIKVVNCTSLDALMEHIAVNSKKRQDCLVGLKKLKLWDLPRLNALALIGSESTLSLPSLTDVSLHRCQSLRYLVTNDSSRPLDNLEMLDISGFNNMEEVAVMQERAERNLKAVKFMHLHTLKLHFLKSLISFSSGNSEYEFPSLRELSILDCTKLKAVIRRLPALGVETMTEGSADFDESPQSLFDEKVLLPSLEQLTLMSLRGLTKIWHNELSEESFCKLASITVCDCENLSHIFPPTLIGRLQSLEMIEVVKCTSLEALVEHVAVNSRKRQDRLVSLEKLKLWDLPRLNALVLIGTEATLSLPSLTNVSLHRCHSLKYLIMNDTSVTLDRLEMLDISGCNNMKEVVVTQERADRNSKAMKFPHLRTLKFHFLKSLISFSSGSSAYELPSLKELSILDCTKFKTFIQRLPTLGVEMMTAGSTGFDESPRFLFDEKVVFPKLEELRLIGIQSRGFWENEMPNESFCQLKVLEVKQCPNLLNAIPSFVWKRLLHCMQSLTVVSCPCVRNLFTMSTAKNLVQLQHLVLDGCEEMEYIVVAEEENPEEVAGINVISKLVTLRLRKMIKLRSFYQGKHTSEWPSLKELTVEDCKAVEAIIGDASCKGLEGSVPTCQPLLLVEKGEFPNMESMKISHMDNMEQIWLGELTTNAFAKLKRLGVEYCEKLSFIFSSHTILTRFQNLEEVTVTNCGSLEVIFHGEESNHDEARPTSKFELKELKLERLPKMKHVWSGRLCGTLAFECLRCLEVESCESLKSLFPVSIAKNMTQLENLLVRDCGVEEIVTEEDGVGLSVGDHFFPQLTDLRLLELPKLRSFYKSSHTTTWLHLKQLQVRHCGKIRSFSFACEFQSGQGTIINENRPALFSFEKVSPVLEGATLTREDVVMLQQLQNYSFGHLRDLSLACFHDETDDFPSDFLLQRFPILEELDVRCSSFEEIFPEDASGHGGAVVPCGGLTDVQKPLNSLGNLKRLDLQKLDKLRRVWKEGSLMAELLKQIKLLFIIECPSLSIVLPSLTSFQKLTQLYVKDCDGLVHLGTCSAMTSLVHLTWLTLRNCAAMEDVVTDDENGAEEISFPKMEELILDGLPRLESFSPTDCAFSFPSLQRVVVKECPKMTIFCKGPLRTPNLAEVLLSEDDDEGPWEGNLNATVQTLSA